MMTAYSPITKYEEYNTRMAAGMLDKLFFVDKTDATVFIDFGCADGTLFRYMRPYLPDAKFIGYDSDARMCSTAREKVKDAEFVHDWFGVSNQVELLHKAGTRVCLILSSILHEVYHYSDPREIDKFWTNIWSAGFDFIALRDMIPSEAVDRPADIGDVQKVLRKHRETKELKDFERRWGSITSNKNLLHYLLKYRYTTPNWEREVKENYLPLYWEDLMGSIPREYDVLYHEHGVLPYVKRAVRTDFGIELKDATHLKLILEKR